MKRQELYNEALRAVARRHQRALAGAGVYRDGLYGEVPQLAQLDAEKNATGAAAARLAAGGRHEEAAEKLKQLDALTTEKKALLKQLGITEADLQPKWHCTACRDTGRANGTVCSCVLQEMHRLRREEVNGSGPLQLSSFEAFRLEAYPEHMEEEGELLHPRAHMQAVLQDCMDWAADFGRKSQSLYMFGYAGLGKTHLALAMANQVLDAGYDVVYVSAQRAFAQIAGDRESGGELFEAMLQADLLVLDDLGTEFMNAYVAGKLYDLVNTRMDRLPTIYTTNICDINTLNARYDEKITSRLLGRCHMVRFWGEDIRIRRP